MDAANTTPTVRVLRLNLKGCYFDAIRDGTKPKEYRLAATWEKRIINGGYRVGVDEILLLHGYPKRGDESRMMRRIWNGYEIEDIQHEHFGPQKVRVLAIDVTKHQNE
tara:strand:- start:357 stop:680 length:324 start_codon:yes stop_codon:yes gene_type:complete